MTTPGWRGSRGVGGGQVNAARSGFTLIELTAALLVASLALSLGYGAYSVLLDRSAAVEAAAAEDLRAAAIRATLAEWIRGVQREALPGGPLLSGIDDQTDGVPTDEITLLTAGPEARSQASLLRLFVERHPASPRRGLAAEWSHAGALEPVRTLVAEEVVGLEVRYWSGILGAHRWLPSWISTTVLPAGVELRLIGAPGEDLHPLLALPLRVAIEAGR